MNPHPALLDAVFGPDSRGETPLERARTSRRRFVRSQGHLAFDNDHATGLRLSAWQALQAFGFEVLVEVLDYSNAILAVAPDEPAATLRQQRDALGLTHEDLASALRVDVRAIADAENPSTRTDMMLLAQLAQALALDETRLAFTPGAGADTALAVRLREIGRTEQRLGPSTVLAFDEAAWVVATHAKLWGWLGDRPSRPAGFQPTDDYGDRWIPAWRVGYRLAQDSRRILGLGEDPILSLRDLMGRTLGIPIVQMMLPREIGGATVSVGDQRGVVANIVGYNQNEWVRRATLAHELGHLLWDPDPHLKHLRVDPYHDLDTLYHDQYLERPFDPVEARANAFAVEFLAPHEGVRELFARSPTPSDGLRNVMEHYGISYLAAKYHVWNAMDRTIDRDSLMVRNTRPTDEWKAQESYTLDYFEPRDVPPSRRGRFAFEVVRAERDGLISRETAALYLRCTVLEYEEHGDIILDLHR